VRRCILRAEVLHADEARGPHARERLLDGCALGLQVEPGRTDEHPQVLRGAGGAGGRLGRGRRWPVGPRRFGRRAHRHFVGPFVPSRAMCHSRAAHAAEHLDCTDAIPPSFSLCSSRWTADAPCGPDLSYDPQMLRLEQAIEGCFGRLYRYARPARLATGGGDRHGLAAPIEGHARGGGRGGERPCAAGTSSRDAADLRVGSASLRSCARPTGSTSTRCLTGTTMTRHSA
jgi:hypothetical protein